MADGRGIKIEDLGVPLGACASSWRVGEGEELLDCDMVRAWRPKPPLKTEDESLSAANTTGVLLFFDGKYLVSATNVARQLGNRSCWRRLRTP